MGRWDTHVNCETHVARFHSQGIIARPGIDSVCWIYIICIQQLLLANLKTYSYIATVI